MHLAVEEKADLPAFLIHDSLRETNLVKADLDGVPYARLFELIHLGENKAMPAVFSASLRRQRRQPQCKATNMSYCE